MFKKNKGVLVGLLGVAVIISLGIIFAISTQRSELELEYISVTDVSGSGFNLVFSTREKGEEIKAYASDVPFGGAFDPAFGAKYLAKSESTNSQESQNYNFRFENAQWDEVLYVKVVSGSKVKEQNFEGLHTLYKASDSLSLPLSIYGTVEDSEGKLLNRQVNVFASYMKSLEDLPEFNRLSGKINSTISTDQSAWQIDLPTQPDESGKNYLGIIVKDGDRTGTRLVSSNELKSAFSTNNKIEITGLILDETPRDEIYGNKDTFLKDYTNGQSRNDMSILGKVSAIEDLDGTGKQPLTGGCTFANPAGCASGGSCDWVGGWAKQCLTPFTGEDGNIVKHEVVAYCSLSGKIERNSGAALYSQLNPNCETAGGRRSNPILNDQCENAPGKLKSDPGGCGENSFSGVATGSSSLASVIQVSDSSASPSSEGIRLGFIFQALEAGSDDPSSDYKILLNGFSMPSGNSSTALFVSGNLKLLGFVYKTVSGSDVLQQCEVKSLKLGDRDINDKEKILSEGLLLGQDYDGKVLTLVVENCNNSTSDSGTVPLAENMKITFDLSEIDQSTFKVTKGNLEIDADMFLDVFHNSAKSVSIDGGKSADVSFPSDSGILRIVAKYKDANGQPAPMDCEIVITQQSNTISDQKLNELKSINGVTLSNEFKDSVLKINVSNCVDTLSTLPIPVSDNSTTSNPSSSSTTFLVRDNVVSAEETGSLSDPLKPPLPGIYEVTVNGVQSKTPIVEVTSEKTTLKYFRDKNNDGVKQLDEEFLDNSDVSELQVSFSKKDDYTDHKYSFEAGWNLIGLPFNSENLSTASSLFDQIEQEFYGGANEVTKNLDMSIAVLDDRNYNVYNRILNRNPDISSSGVVQISKDFSLVPGRALFVYVNQTFEVSLPGKDYAANQEEFLGIYRQNAVSGWNMINFYAHPGKKLSEIAGIPLEVGRVTKIASFSSGKFETIVIDDEQVFGNDYETVSLKGYFVFVE